MTKQDKEEHREERPNNGFTSMYETKARTLIERLHELIDEGIMPRFHSNTEEFCENMEINLLENMFRAYEGGIEYNLGVDEGAIEDGKMISYEDKELERFTEKQKQFNRFLLIFDHPDEGVYDFHLRF